MKKILAITIVALTLVATVLGGCASKEPGAVTALVTTSADERYPVWSPGGSQLAFVTGKAIPGGLDRDIYVIDLPDN